MPVAECSWHPWPTASCDFEQFPKLFLLLWTELFAEQRCSLNTLYELSLVIIEIFLFYVSHLAPVGDGTCATDRSSQLVVPFLSRTHSPRSRR